MPPRGAGRSAGVRSRSSSVLLLDRRAADLRARVPRHLPAVHCRRAARGHRASGPWHDQLLATLDAMARAQRASSAVVVADSCPEERHARGRAGGPAAPGVSRYSCSPPTGEARAAPSSTSCSPSSGRCWWTGEVPEDTWTRVARHWHECYRLSHPPPPGDPGPLTRLPWSELDAFLRQDNILQLRSIMSATVARGRRWVPEPVVAPGSFIELSDHDLTQIARAEHTRWYRRRLAAGWSATGSAARAWCPGEPHELCPWAALPAEDRRQRLPALAARTAGGCRLRADRPGGRPARGGRFLRIGTVQASRLHARRPWTRTPATDCSGAAGDWQVAR